MKNSLLKITSIAALGVAVYCIVVKVSSRKKKEKSRCAWDD